MALVTAAKICPDFYTDVSPAVRALIFTLALMAHGIALALMPSIKSVDVGDKAPGVLQVRWGTNGQDLEPPAAPAPKLAPGPLPMRSPPVASKPKARAEPTANPALARHTATPDPTSPAAEFADHPAQAESQTASSSETAPVAQSEGAGGASGAQSGAASGVSNGANPGFSEPVFEAAYLSNPRPEYPALSRRLSEQGMVILNIHVTAEGKADKVLLHQSCGFERLDKAASDVVWRWRFTPARQGGKNVAAWVLVPIRFALRG
ncbi:hypothetical protein AGMMS49545_03470 [Betaproteobacteria bacterium]|nr:hypothetical protein AGMMS49545_03470 [Betaproteobacteria bacterium]GHU46180.1 hypothetical protein AGMMS50289_18970 [Betaproteobacteria bacterium]